MSRSNPLGPKATRFSTWGGYPPPFYGDDMWNPKQLGDGIYCDPNDPTTYKVDRRGRCSAMGKVFTNDPRKWIDLYVQRHHGRVNGLCQLAVKEMHEAFPELTPVPGHVIVGGCKRVHWWLVDCDDNIIDPTVSQFSPHPSDYIPWTSSQPVVIGKCLHCGTSITAYLNYLNDPLQIDSFDSSFCTTKCSSEFLKLLQPSTKV